ncbi:hypothetical protein Tco_1485300 [Tanacetum coccineum]
MKWSLIAKNLVGRIGKDSGERRFGMLTGLYASVFLNLIAQHEELEGKWTIYVDHPFVIVILDFATNTFNVVAHLGIEEGILGVYEVIVACDLIDGSTSLVRLRLTNLKLSVLEREMVAYHIETPSSLAYCNTCEVAMLSPSYRYHRNLDPDFHPLKVKARHLRSGCFFQRLVSSHGQLYVPVSKIKSGNGLKILCCDKDELRNMVLQPMILPMDKYDFETSTLPALVPVLSTAAGETLLLLVKHAELIFNKASQEHLISHVLPMLMRAYDDDDARIQEEVLKKLYPLLQNLILIEDDSIMNETCDEDAQRMHLGFYQLCIYVIGLRAHMF